jgi:hypothetical protein
VALAEARTRETPRDLRTGIPSSARWAVSLASSPSGLLGLIGLFSHLSFHSSMVSFTVTQALVVAFYAWRAQVVA